jgi:hypothetical protein
MIKSVKLGRMTIDVDNKNYPSGRAMTELSKLCGISENAIKELLSAGWTYQERLNEPITWVRDAVIRKA